jgi:phospholipid/cholesterol/gamma-HCH transport system permease protein
VIVQSIERIGHILIRAVEESGRFARLAFLTVATLFRPPFRLRAIFRQMEFVGWQSLLIVVITAAFTGAVFALQSNVAFSMFGAQGLVGATVALSLTRELGPALTALMVTGRAGSAMAAEIGTMRVSEQIDALEAMAVDPIEYLVKPRVLAGVVMVPVLTAVFDFVGIFGAWVVGMFLLHISEGPFLWRIGWYVDPDDIYLGLQKAAVFGFILTAVGCYKGFYTTGGAEGVGRATTQAVVIASVSILISDYFLTAWLMI